jgi:hypothetical protein
MTKRTLYTRWLLGGLCFFISGCADAVLVAKLLNPPNVALASEQDDAEAKRFQPRPGKASIYVIREDIFAGQNVLFQVSLDGKDQGKLSRGTYFLFTVPPGEHIVNFAQAAGEPDPGRGTEKIYAVEGGIYYLEIRPRSSLTAPPTNIFRIYLERGRQMILGGKRAEVNPAK